MVTPDIMLSYEEWLPILNWSEVFKQGYANASFPLYIMLKPNADLSAKMPEILSRFKTYYWPYQEEHTHELSVKPLTELYFSSGLRGGTCRHGSQKLIGILFSAAILILLFAVINYINLSTAQSESRPGRWPVRRLLGAHAKRFSPG